VIEGGLKSIAISNIVGRLRGKTRKKQELALNASNKETLSSIIEGQLSVSEIWNQILEQLNLKRTYLGSLQCTRIYFGNEFCQLLLPSIAELAKTIQVLEEQDVRFTFLTPYVSDYGLTVLSPLLDFLNAHEKMLDWKIEVVVNDWGVLRLLKSKYKSLTPILGRLMLKMKKDPRLSFKTHRYFSGKLHLLNQCSLTVPIYRDFLREYNIKRIELDFLQQGIGMNFSEWDMEASLHLPINYITTSRLCSMASLGKEPKDKLKYYNVKCERECQKYETELIPMERGTLVEGTRLFYQGNTVFSVPLWREKISSLQELIQIGITRLIFTLKIPM
jgi:hypothetical protein